MRRAVAPSFLLPGLFALLIPPAARAEIATPDTEQAATPAPEESDRETSRARLLAMTRRGPYFALFGTAMFGDGFRFNNPYRLSKELGDGGQSVSTIGPYLDLALGATTGKPDGLQHGARLAWSVCTSGVPQQVVTPSYLALLRVAPAWIAYGWAGFPVLIEPDLNIGGEIAVGAAWLARAGVGATFALVADGFYGAGSRDTRASFYPVLSGQLGLFVNYEVLP